MTQDYSGYYGHIRTDESNAELLERHGVALGPYDRGTSSFPAHAQGRAYDALVAFATGQRGGYQLQFVHREQSTCDAGADRLHDLGLDALRGEIAYSQYMAALEPARDPTTGYWEVRRYTAQRVYNDVLGSAGPLVRLSAEGEIELSSGAFGIPDATEGTVTVRVYFDRGFNPSGKRAPVIEQAVPLDTLTTLLGREPARRAQLEFATWDLRDNAVTLQDDAVPLTGALAQRILAQDWDPKLAANYPALDLPTIADVLRLAVEQLPAVGQSLSGDGISQAQLRELRVQRDAAKGLSSFSLVDLAGFGQILQHAKELLLQRDAIGAKWAAQRIEHVLDARTHVSLQPRPSRQHPFARNDFKYLIAEDIPYAPAVPHSDMGTQRGGRFYWGLTSWVPTKREAEQYDLHAAEKRLREMLPRCPRAFLVPADAPAPAPRRAVNYTVDATP
ncbi:hypothetical protein [Cupriavidus pampae]|uniref:Uncharacterized protein n=1 Tax=Cupriavidus pampae TaxID=659251 RepID=A0ABM8XVT4_9BURK|nr:hypothetical protein [Cupriavidus pampae]CAG9184486.1 hypothetical protein LMG32289_05636 [Cupriavidus pampae]